MEKNGRSMKDFPSEQGSTAMKQPDEVAAEGWAEYQKPDRASVLEGYKEWLSEQMREYRNNAEVVWQELAQKKEIHVSLQWKR